MNRLHNKNFGAGPMEVDHVYDSLKEKPKLHSSNLQSVNSHRLRDDVWAEVPFEVTGIKMSHPFYIVRNMIRKIILGRDWLQKNGVRIL